MQYNVLNINETKISLTTDLENHFLKDYILTIRNDLKDYINQNPLFLSSLKPLNNIKNEKYNIVNLMIESSKIANVGPMASVSGSIAELSCNYLINSGSSHSIVENGGDISLINNKKIICNIATGNKYLNDSIAFKLKTRKNPIGIASSSSKTGLSLNFGDSDLVTVISKKASYADSLATSIANEVKGNDPINNSLEYAENFREFFQGALIIKDTEIGTIGNLPEIISKTD